MPHLIVKVYHIYLNISLWWAFSLTFKYLLQKRRKERLQLSDYESEVAQSCPTLGDPMDYSLPGFSVYGILQARVLKWVAISFSRGSSHPRDWSRVSCIVGRCFTIWATREVLSNHKAIVLGAPNFSLFIPFFRDSSANSSRFLICFSVLSICPLFHFN